MAGRDLLASAALESLLTNFLRWKPAPITSVVALVRAVAPLTRLLRGEVLDQLAAERRAVAGGADEYAQPFTGLAHDWRALLFPQASDATFADGYAQTVTFALLLARTEDITVTGVPLHEIGAALGSEHSLMGKALQLLTDDVAADFRVTLDLLEGQTPDVPTRIFPGVRQPLAIGLFLRTPDASDQVPAVIRHRAVSGLQEEKFIALEAVGLDDDGWREARMGWTEPLTPAAAGQWDTYPALSDIFPWYSPGVFPTRTWVYAPNRALLQERWAHLISAPASEKAELFKEGSEPRLESTFPPLVELEPSQADLLTRVLAGELLSAHDLRAAGTRWPVTGKDRKPRYSYNNLKPVESSGHQGTLGD